MSSINSIASEKLARLIGTPKCPALIDVRTEEDFAADPRLGLARLYADGLEQLEAGLTLYDAFYRWRRDASNETHNWPANKKGP